MIIVFEVNYDIVINLNAKKTGARVSGLALFIL